jgi:hypothetical protein
MAAIRGALHLPLSETRGDTVAREEMPPEELFAMKRSERESINRANVNVTRTTREPEDIDIAADATEGAPAKSLAPPANKSGRRPGLASGKPSSKRR